MFLKIRNLNNFQKVITVVIVIVFVSIFSFLLQNSNIPKITEVQNINYVKIVGKILKVDLALTSQEQKQGLSGRKELKEDESMLFVFDHIDKYPFWMKDMNFPIDIIWISSDLKVVYIKKDATPESYPESFTPTVDSKYVLEVFSSFSEKNNLKEGDSVEFLSS